jgi:Tol biopolymer transport system component
MSAISERMATAPRVPLRTVAVGLIVLALIAGAIVIVGNQPQRLPAPFGPAANGRVAYSADGDIFTVDPTTGEARAIVTGPEADSSPVYSLDGTKIAFTRTVAGGQREIWVVDAEGGSPTRVTPEPLSTVSAYRFAPDGKTIMIDRLAPEIGAGSIISIANTDGSYYRDLGHQGSASSPAFRPPDGREIAFVGGSATDGQGIFALDLADGSVRTIVEPVNGYEVSGGPAFSPDGSMIAYGWWGSGVAGETEGLSRVYLVDADGAGAPRLVEPPAGDSFCCDGYPAWSNDGTRLAFSRWYGTPDRSVVAIADAQGRDSSTEIDLGQPLPGAVGDPAWSPDDRFILLRPDTDRVLGDQILLDVTKAAPVPIEWTATSAPAWQRIAAP